MASRAEEISGRAPYVRFWYARAVIIGVILTPLNAYWVMACELHWHNILTINTLFVTPIFNLFCLVGVNALLRRFLKRYVLRPPEMLIIYSMLVMCCTVCTHDWLRNLVAGMQWPAWHATPENRWEKIIFPLLPKWLFVWDKELIEGYYTGNSSFYDPKVLLMWLRPALFWTLFTVIVGWMMVCLTTLIRKAWMDDTKLSFPVVRLPLAMMEEDSPSSILRSRALWMGFGLIAILDLVNGLSVWYPNVPHFGVTIGRSFYFNNPPWTAAASGANPIFVTLFPFSIGLAFLVPLDVSFSMWFFYFFGKAEAVIGTLLGYGEIPDFPFLNEQGLGAWWAFGIFLLITMRRYLVNVIRQVFKPTPGADADEPMSYRVAFWGLIAGMAAFFVFWCVAGMRPWLVIVVLVTYLLLALCITRVRAESGAQHGIESMEPMVLAKLFGSQFFGPSNLALAAVSHWYWRMHRSHMMPNQMEAFKLAQDTRSSYRALVFPMILAIFLATVFGLWTSMHIFYEYGAASKVRGFASFVGTQSYDWLATGLTQGFKPQVGRWWAVAFGGGMVALLSSLRLRFVGFPFHPLGFCVGAGGQMIWHWCPFFIAWLVKLTILRYGGLTFYRKAVPFFLGLILGDYVMGAAWSLVGLILNRPVYGIWS